MLGLPLAVGRGRAGQLLLRLQWWGATELIGLLLRPAVLLLLLLLVLAVVLLFVFVFLTA
jgi:hypothetical protein